VSPLLGNRRCHANHFVLHSLGSSSCWLPSMNLIRQPRTELLQVLTGYTLRYVVILTFNLSILESCHVMPLWCSIRVPSLNMILLTVPELRRLQFSIDRQLSPNFYVFRGYREVKFQISSF